MSPSASSPNQQKQGLQQMKLASFRADGADRIGLELQGSIVDIAQLIEAPGDMIGFIASGRLEALPRDLATADTSRLRRYSPDEVEWLPPVRTPSKIVCIALNNRSLDAIKIKAPTDHPAFFLKPYTALTGHRTAIRIKRKFGFTHPEPELAVVIGKTLRDATPHEAIAAVFGYSILNDVTCVGMREEDCFSLRYFRPEGDRMVEDVAHTSYPGRYKASDTFAPMGPWLVTADEIPDPAALSVRCHMDDRLVASDHTGNYVWSVADALSHISQTMTLLPGDVVSMGTAVGGDQDDPAAPHIPGVTRCDIAGFEGVIEIEITGLGSLVNTVETIA
jgi:2-keto-4-pentenoate hydratase/2-oxohepta-3-ene-1,7-dioic acid hydratase in catechol pathway